MSGRPPTNQESQKEDGDRPPNPGEQGGHEGSWGRRQFSPLSRGGGNVLGFRVQPGQPLSLRRSHQKRKSAPTFGDSTEASGLCRLFPARRRRVPGCAHLMVSVEILPGFLGNSPRSRTKTFASSLIPKSRAFLFHKISWALFASTYALRTIQNEIQPRCKFDSDFENLADSQPPTFITQAHNGGL